MTNFAERACVALFLAYLVWLPLPFGSAIASAYVPLVAPPLLLAAAAAGLCARRPGEFVASGAYRVWTAGSVLFLVVIVMQLVPVPAPLLALISRESYAIWNAAGQTSAIATGAFTTGAHPISIDPASTRHEFFRFAALVAAFQAAAMLIRTHERRLAFAGAICVATLFEVFYGVREAALRRYAIWGWVNRLIFDRVTGTFVNPNHFAHYVSLAIPFAGFLAAVAWLESGNGDTPLQRRLKRLIERRLLLVSGALLTAAACVAAILLAQSRGALLALSGALAATAAAAAVRSRTVGRHPAVAFAALALAFVLFLSALVIFLGRERTVERFKPTAGQEVTLVGRTVGISSALAVWRHFPLFGSGFGTFPSIVSIAQKEEVDKLFQHAHDDYAEILATTGLAGAAIGFTSLLGGWILLARAALLRPWHEGSPRRRAFQSAAWTSITMVLIHALFDFNFYIPANAATVAAIAGAAVAWRLREPREPAARGGFSSRE
jgi:hypothetical protein